MPPQHLLDERIDVRQVPAVRDAREAVGPDDVVELGLGECDLGRVRGGEGEEGQDG